MSQLKKDTFYQKAKEKIKNKGLVYGSAAVIAISAALVMSGRSCCVGSSTPTTQPIAEGPRRYDGSCDPEERYVFQLDPQTRAIKRDAQGNPIPNPFYLKEDCFRGDGVCDNDPTRVLDQAGRPYQFHEPGGKAVSYVLYKDGRRFGDNGPLESETDVDCIMQLVREKGCMPLADTNRVYIDRPAVRSRLGLAEPLVERSGDGQKILAYILPPTPYILRPMEGTNSWAWAHENPESQEHRTRVFPGYNFEFMTFARDEVCPTDEAAKTLQLCTPESITACICPNLRGCAPPEDSCGNGRIDRGEKCDPRATPTGCPRGQVCAPGCKRCQRAPDPCGNGTIDPGESCDPRAVPTGCGSGQRCAPGCRQCVSDATHSECSESRCVTVAGAGDDQCSSNADCAPPPPPPPTPCDGSVLSRLRRAALNSLTSAKAQVRSAVGASPQQSVNATVPVAVSGGVPSVSGSVSLSGPGSGSVGSGLVDLSSVSFTLDVNCTGTVVVTVSGDN